MSKYFRKYFRLRCEDGVTRSIRVRCRCYNGRMSPDTSYSVPADAVIYGVYVTGYVTTLDGEIFDFKGGGALFRVDNSGLAKLPADKRGSFRILATA